MTGELGTAEFAATTLIHVITSKLVPIAFDEQSTARSTIGTGIKVVERLLLDRIDAKTGRPPVAGQHHAFTVCLSNEAKAALIRTQFAFARAEVALDSTVGKPVPPLSAHDAGFYQLTGKRRHTISEQKYRLVFRSATGAGGKVSAYRRIGVWVRERGMVLASAYRLAKSP